MFGGNDLHIVAGTDRSIIVEDKLGNDETRNSFRPRGRTFDTERMKSAPEGPLNPLTGITLKTGGGGAGGPAGAGAAFPFLATTGAAPGAGGVVAGAGGAPGAGGGAVSF